ncbi:dihydroxyacetone kinase subunit L [Streptacidiphilus sp. ASG 303]|uniref:dihydroxyacetone kinase subunit DhaL n=1 Tax=Streptacidiphilus sp. ASG 303 TaxID=2896847 RepID=UPI001E63BDA9|nr:dihydroxyacetone kinase subunit DhaL [Streptacidiphilus sp. ASG 303]MCD0483734.1 dihydroxyacetone kinase subunit L [Streptacidiphilus sp. ASG 303]
MPTVPVLDTAFFRHWLELAADTVRRESARLTELDSPIGDADHGTNMDRGFTAARLAVLQDPPQSPGGLLVTVGRTLISSVGGASGPLYGTALRRAGRALGDAPEATPPELGEALAAAVAAVRELGGAEPGDKTMVDALLPASQAYTGALADGLGVAAALDAAAGAALAGAEATVPLLARKGRASYLGERSIGHQDPGATSAALLVGCLRDAAEARPGADGPGADGPDAPGADGPEERR